MKFSKRAFRVTVSTIIVIDADQDMKASECDPAVWDRKALIVSVGSSDWEIVESVELVPATEVEVAS